MKMEPKILTYTVDVKEFKERGYAFQKLYARNYKSYNKKINGWDIWVFQKGKELYIKDWFETTAATIEFWKANVEQIRKDNVNRPTMSGSPYNYMPCEIHEVTNEIRLRGKEYYTWLIEQGERTDGKYEEYPWSERILTTESFQAVVDEIEYLTKK